ncbi:hypothetical protein [Umezawaea sp. Da 62-37]|uniref:hypothetical protein n=1 Tax=Umezawaea sp. Da 62-37 TaxID=3075927 RepID=UPI0028F743D5|nr:hypothetical protein [Umezawaea sp. Da 62-37]WNV90337.1 hypothetical protein RM788_19265 [Umezawaea sp. Da 62-37]
MIAGFDHHELAYIVLDGETEPVLAEFNLVPGHAGYWAFFGTEQVAHPVEVTVLRRAKVNCP